MSCRRLKWQTHGQLSVWVIMQQDQDGQKFQNIGESRDKIGVDYRRTSKIQRIHDDVHQLLEADIFGSQTWVRCRANPNDLLNNDHYAFKAHNDYIGLDT